MVRDESTVTPRTYLVVFILLILFTLMEVGIRYVAGLPSGVRIGALVLLAGAKVMLVLLFFMHLIRDDTLFWLPVIIAAISGITLIMLVTLVPEAVGIPAGAGTTQAMAGMGGAAAATQAPAGTPAAGAATQGAGTPAPGATTSATGAATQGAGAATQGVAGNAQSGDQLSQQLGCASCHSTDGSQGAGPTWKGLAGSTVTLSDGSTVTADANYMAQSIVSPDSQIVQGYQPGIMPQNYGQQLSQSQIADLVAYMVSLGQGSGESGMAMPQASGTAGATVSASPAAAGTAAAPAALAAEIAPPGDVATPSADPTVVQAGLNLARAPQCLSCHSPDGSPSDSPTWKGLYMSTVTLSDGSTVVADAAYLTRSIAEPDAQVVQGYSPGMMPNLTMMLGSQQVYDLVSYIASLK